LNKRGEQGPLEWEKVFSHVDKRIDGKGGDQDRWKSIGNEKADRRANDGRVLAQQRDTKVSIPEGMGRIMLVHEGGLILDDPRKTIRTRWGEAMLARWAAQPTQGAMARAIEEKWVLPNSLGSQTGPQAGRLTGGKSRSGFINQARLGILPVPTQLCYRGVGKGKWKLASDGRARCPLCESEEAGDSNHCIAHWHHRW
jgi:hypothetical protein